MHTAWWKVQQLEYYIGKICQECVQSLSSQSSNAGLLKNYRHCTNPTACAIQSEITIIWAGYYENAGTEIEKLGKNQPFLVHYPIGKNFSTIYSNNASSIGHLDDSELRKIMLLKLKLQRNNGNNNSHEQKFRFLMLLYDVSFLAYPF